MGFCSHEESNSIFKFLTNKLVFFQLFDLFTYFYPWLIAVPKSKLDAEKVKQIMHIVSCPSARLRFMDLSHNSSRERGAKSLVGKKNRAKPETAPEQCARSVLSGAFSLLLFLCGVSASSRLSLRLGNWCRVTKVALWKALLRWQRSR